MGEKYAVRNLRLCTKDCMCLYVWPHRCHRYRKQYHRCQPVHRLRSMCRCLPVVRDFDGPEGVSASAAERTPRSSMHSGG